MVQNTAVLCLLDRNPLVVWWKEGSAKAAAQLGNTVIECCSRAVLGAVLLCKKSYEKL